MRIFCARLVGGCLFILQLWPRGSHVAAAGSWRASGMIEEQRACCGAIIDDAAEMVFTGGVEEKMIPLACHKHRVGCPALRFEAHTGTATGSALERAIQQQVDLRSRPSCDAGEWEGRCPSGSTMLLADQRGRCLAAGCVSLGEPEAAALGQHFFHNKEDEEEATLRAVAAQEFYRLRGTTTGPPPTFYRHSKRLRKSFVKGQTILLDKLKAAITSTANVTELRLLLDKADSDGFRGGKIYEARRIVQKHDREQRSLAFLRRLPGMAMSQVARLVEGAKKKAMAKESVIESLLANRRIEMDAKERAISGLEQEVQALSGTVDRLSHAARVEMAGKAEAVGARDQARVDLATFSARAHALDAVAAKLEGSMAAALAGQDQHPIPANETCLMPAREPDDEPPVEAVLERASTRLQGMENMTVSFANEMVKSVEVHKEEVSGLKQRVRSLEKAATVRAEEVKVIQGLLEELMKELASREAKHPMQHLLDHLFAQAPSLGLVIVVLIFERRRRNPAAAAAAAASQEEVPDHTHGEEHGDDPPRLPLPPEPAQVSAAAPLLMPDLVRCSGGVEVLSLPPPADVVQGGQLQGQEAGPAAAVAHAPPVDAEDLSVESGGQAAPLSAHFDEDVPPESRQGGVAAVAVGAEPALSGMDNDSSGDASSSTLSSADSVPSEGVQYAEPALSGVDSDSSGDASSSTLSSADSVPSEGVQNAEPALSGVDSDSSGDASSSTDEGVQSWPVRLMKETINFGGGLVELKFQRNVLEQAGPDPHKLLFAFQALRTGELVEGVTLGRGTFGTVKEVRHVQLGGPPIALKKVLPEPNGGLNFNSMQCAMVEMVVFARMAGRPHPNVLYALAMDAGPPSMPIILPRAMGDMHAFRSNGTSTMEDWLSLVVDLAQGAAHLHEAGIVHRDIKPGNLLVFETEDGFQGRLADFGLARGIGERCSSREGSEGYMAHETMLDGDLEGSAAQDVVGVAVTLLRVCLRNKWRLARNLFTLPDLLTDHEMARHLALLLRRARGARVSADLLDFQFDVARRTMSDGTFIAWLGVDKMHAAIRSPEEVVEQIPAYLAANPAYRGTMDGLCQLAKTVRDRMIDDDGGAGQGQDGGGGGAHVFPT
ncbi:unnamed protein product [Scytosiphon promiscuus]